MSANTTSSLKDFELQLSFLGRNVLDEEAFNALLDNIGYKRSREGLFESLLNDVASAGVDSVEEKKALGSRRFVTVEDIAKMYGSDPYHIFDNGEDAGVSLMAYVDKMFHKSDDNGDGVITKDEFRAFFYEVVGPAFKNYEADEAFDIIDVHKSGAITLAQFKEGILKPNKNKSSGLPRTFNHNLISPTVTTSDEFVSALERYTKNHRAVSHHLLENIACASFGKKNTADVILLFLSAYAKFNSGFVERVQKLINFLDNPKERDVLLENVKEEMGFYDEKTLQECDAMGIPRKSVDSVPHHQLFLELVKTIERKVKCSYFDYIPEDLNEEMVQIQNELTKKGKIGLLASLYFGSELIVPYIYSSLLVGLRLCLNITHEESRFLLLHVSMDSDHAENIRDIIVTHCKTAEDRIELVKCTEKVLNGRVAFYDRLVSFNNLQSLNVNVSKLYDNQATKWSREKPSLLSDFTGRPIVYDLIREHVEGACVIDVGCGEGFVSRTMTKMGAKKVVGIDVSPGMINCAKVHPNKGVNEFFLVGDASGLKQNLIDQWSSCNIMLGENFDVGTFDLGVAVFLFNYMSISSMNKTFEDVHSVLKPGGHFVFSVPHPFMASHNTSAFGFNSNNDSTYFALRDKCLEGHIARIDGDKLNVRMHFKTIEDYINAATSNGFEIISFTEARVRAEDMVNNISFFSAINGHPLHIVIKVRKPVSAFSALSLSSMNTLDILPKKLNWPRTLTNNIENSLVMWLPPAVNDELIFASLQVYEKGITVDNLNIGNDITAQPSDRCKSGERVMPETFSAIKAFATNVRNRLLHETGAVVIKGLDMSALGGAGQLDKMTACSKIAYFLICEHIGKVDATARGRLFDVKSANIDAMSKMPDNVLVSVSDSDVGWHTDGASKDRTYDVVSLLCISPAAEGGKIKLSNACDVYDELNRALPKFLMYELTRVIPRDILENGGGKGIVGAADALSRSADILAMRIRYNSYPIYRVEGDRMRFRYMRHWIETGHEKTFWKVPTFLRIAMDILDDHLDEACCFHQALERGDMIFANNAMLAHARDQFKNEPDAPPRHKVRAWIQVQKVAIANKTEIEGGLDPFEKKSGLSRVESLTNMVLNESR
eukprot:CAMPEP_0171330372 /NCGR_PEP_ID=MMETSP0878-20121228/1957_1 /TAXON_ID=67004 /ORGANISM="Thalassiosira weissflogii, Strain CCMP1336" /LENGTH=1114 /DNA_ID=CAMNT_0011830647 /DNA_START=649 /DNA_END=3993 /DNA_ORIENTATION=-